VGFLAAGRRWIAFDKEGLDGRQREERRWERKRANVLAFIKSRKFIS